MNKLKPILHEINNADQLISEIRDSLKQNKPLDHAALVIVQKCLSRAIELFRAAEDKVLDAITDDLNATISILPDDEYNHAKESGDVDYSAIGQSSNIIRQED